MIRTGRQPANQSERMIFNNFRAMTFISDNHSSPLTVETIKRIHRIVTDGTLDNPDAAGRFQQPDEERIVVENQEGELFHRPPPAELLEERMEAFCRFANHEDGGAEWIHPVTRAILLHFWMGYDHPFEDGNGRTARAIFYWAMLNQGYWLTEYLSISSILKKGPAKYARSFLYSEMDENDLTYFILFQLGVIKRAVESMHAWLRRKMEEIRSVEAVLTNTDFNHRQVALLGHALRHPGASYTYKGHALSHDVTLASARKDLLGLEEHGLLVKLKRGRQHEFRPPKSLPEALKHQVPT
jgi:Fic family protein